MGSCVSVCDGGRVLVDGDTASSCVQYIPYGVVDALEDAIALETNTFEEIAAEPSEAVQLSINGEDKLGSRGADFCDESAPIEASVPELRRSASPAPGCHLGTLERARDDLDQPELWQSVSASSSRTPSTIVSAAHEKLVNKFLLQHSFRHAGSKVEDAVVLETHAFEEIVAEPSEAVQLPINHDDKLGSRGGDFCDESAPIEANAPELRRSASPAPGCRLGTLEGARDDLDDQPELRQSVSAQLWQSVSDLSTRTPSTIVSAEHEKLVRKFLLQHSFRHADDSRRASRWPFARRRSPLRVAADLGDVRMVKLLLRHGADPSRPGVLPDEGSCKRSQHGWASREEARQILLDVRRSPEARQVIEQDSLLDVSVAAKPADWETLYFDELRRRLHFDPLF